MIYMYSLALIAVLSIALFMLFKKKPAPRRFVQLSAQNIPLIRAKLVDRERFDQQLLARQTEARFQRRECTLFLFRFQTDNTGVEDAMVDLLVGHMQAWPVAQEFFIHKVGKNGFVVLVEDVALPDESRELEDELHIHLNLPMGAAEESALEYTLARGSYPYDTDQINQLWELVDQRLVQREHTAHTLTAQPSVEVREDGVLVIDLGATEGVSYTNVESAFQLFLDQYAVFYPGIKFPQLCKARRVLSLDADAMRFTRSKVVTDAISAVAVVPRGSIEKHLMRMYTYYNQPQYPFKVCSSEADAITWLQGHVDPKFFTMHRRAVLQQCHSVHKAHREIH